MLPWFKANTLDVIEGMLGHEWAEPAPLYLAVIEYQAIIAAGRQDKWSHDKLAKRWKRPICWARKVRAMSSSQADSKPVASESQADSKPVARKSQEDSKLIAGESQARSSNGAGSGAFDSKEVAGKSQEDSRPVAGESQADSKQFAASRARILDPKILDREGEGDREEEKKEDPPAPQGGMVQVVSQQPAQLAIVQPAIHEQKAPAKLPSMLSSLSSRPDAKMWATIWSKLPAKEKPYIIEIVKVWDAYRAVFPERRVLDDDGAKKIGEALALGYSVEDLCKVPAGARLSPFHMGQNDKGKKYIDVVSLYREARTIDAHVERIQQANKQEPRQEQPKGQQFTRNAFGGREEVADFTAFFGGKR